MRSRRPEPFGLAARDMPTLNLAAPFPIAMRAAGPAPVIKQHFPPPASMLASRQSRSQKKSQEETTTLAAHFDWNEFSISDELVRVGKTLQELSETDFKKVTKEQLTSQLADLTKAYIHAVSQESGPREAGEEDLDKEEARVANRAANARSAAGAKGKSQAETDKEVAIAVAKERERLVDKAVAEAEAAQAKLVAADKLRKEAEADAKKQADIAAAAHEQELKNKETELQATRARVKAAEDAAEKLKRERAKPAEVEDEEAPPQEKPAEPAPKKRKTAAQLKASYIEEHGEEAWDVEVENKKRKAKVAAAKKEAVLKAKYEEEFKKDQDDRVDHADRQRETVRVQLDKLEMKFKDEHQKRKRAVRAIKKLGALATSYGASESEIDQCMETDA